MIYSCQVKKAFEWCEILAVLLTHDFRFRDYWQKAQTLWTAAGRPRQMLSCLFSLSYRQFCYRKGITSFLRTLLFRAFDFIFTNIGRSRE